MTSIKAFKKFESRSYLNFSLVAGKRQLMSETDQCAENARFEGDIY